MEDIGFDNNQSTPVRNDKNNKKIILGIVIVAIIVCVIVVAVTVSVNTNETKKSIDIVNSSMTVEYIEGIGYKATVTGTAKNNTGKNLSYAQISFSLYDSAGNNIGTAFANINSLGKGDTWSFKATLLGFSDTQPISYKFSDSSFF